MKKLLAMSMILMIEITSISCSNDSIGTGTSEPAQKKTINTTNSKVGDDVSREEQNAIDFVKASVTGKIVPGNNPYGNAVINCHTNYLSNTGHACVSSGGYLFNVSWTDQILYPDGIVGYYPDGPVYTSKRVSSCNC